MAQVTATIASKVGLHARPAATFVKAVAEKGVPVTIAKEGGAAVDASSILGVMTLGAGFGDVVTLATPLGDETLWSKRAIAAIEEPPFGSASAHEESGSDVEQTDNDIQDSEQDAAEPQS